MKKISLFILAIMLTITSCKNYDDDFKDLNKSIAELQAQVAGFSSLQAGITALQSSVASLQTTVNALQVDLSGLEADLAAALANIASLQADLNTVIANYATSTDLSTAQASIDALTTALAAAQADLDELLTGNNVYDGDLRISNDAELDFAIGLGNKVMIINGYLNVSGDLDVAKVNLVTSKIVSVVEWVYIEINNGSVDLSALTSVGGNYEVYNTDAMDDALTSVGGWVYLDYDGGYSQPNLASANGLSLSDYETGVDLAGDAVGTLMVDFSGLTVNIGNTGDFSSATSVKLKNAFTIVTAPKALTVDMLAADYRNGLTVSAAKAGSAITITGNMFSGTTYGNLAVTGSATSTLSAAAVTKAGTITVNGIATALSFPDLTVSGAVIAPATVSFSAPLLVVPAGTVTDLSAAKTVSVASATLAEGVIEDLTFSALATTFASSKVKTATVTGKVGSTNGFTSTSAVLASATFAGELDAVSVTGGTLLTSLSTTGEIDSFTLGTSPIITAVSLGHSHIAGSAGSSLYITGNAELASLTTSTNYLLNLVVTDNAKLAAMNFASYANVISAGAMTITIDGNKLSGDYSDAVAVTGTTPYVQTVITSADLATLKPFINAYKAALAASPATTTATLTMLVTMSDVDPSTSVTTTLVAAMAADTDHLPAWASATGITTVAEFLLIQ